MKGFWTELSEYISYTIDNNEYMDHDYGVVYGKEGYPIDWSEMNYRARFFTKIWDILKMTVTLAVCHYKGHDWEDHSYGGPDGGCIDLECTRCGYNFHSTLY